MLPTGTRAPHSMAVLGLVLETVIIDVFVWDSVTSSGEDIQM